MWDLKEYSKMQSVGAGVRRASATDIQCELSFEGGHMCK